MKITSVIQARVGSTRLPKKIIRPFWKTDTILDLIIQNLKSLDYPIVLATSKESNNDILVNFGEKYDIKLFRGDENDVLYRFLEATQGENTDFIIRVCADNPFLDMGLAKALITHAVKDNFQADYYSYQYDNKPTILTHFGVFVELVRREALVKASKLTQDMFYREHVTNFIYKHPDIFNINYKNIDPSNFLPPHTRLTVDTFQDFEMAQQIYTHLTKNNQTINTSSLTKYLEAHENLLNTMRQIIFSNQKI